MLATPDQLRAAPILLRLQQSDLARRAQTSIVTIRRLEAPDGHRRLAPATIDTIQTALEQAGAEFIPHGLHRRQPPDTLLDDLRAISHRSAARLQGHPSSPTPTSTTPTASPTDRPNPPSRQPSSPSSAASPKPTPSSPRSPPPPPSSSPPSTCSKPAWYSPPTPAPPPTGPISTLPIARAAIQLIPQDATLTDAAATPSSATAKAATQLPQDLGDCAAYALAKSRALPLLFKGKDFPHTDLTPAL